MTLLSPVSALLVVRLPASATSAPLVTRNSWPAMVLIWPPANSISALPLRRTAPVSVLAVPKLAVPEVMSSVDRAVLLPAIVISLALFNVSVWAVATSALEMPVLPTLKLLPLVLVMFSPPPIDRLDPPKPPRSPPSRLILPMPLSLSPPLVLIEAPFCSNRSPVTLLSPVSALLVVRLPASATSAPLLTSCTVPAMVLICPLANSSRALPLRRTAPVSVLAVPKLAVPEVMSSVDRAVPLPAMVISLALFNVSVWAVATSALEMPVLPTLKLLPLALVMVRPPPIRRLDPPLPPISPPSRLIRPLTLSLSPLRVLIEAPSSRNRAPVTLFRSNSALLVVRPPASATSASLLTSTKPPAMVLICPPPANSSSALPTRLAVPVSVLAVPKLAVPEVMSSVDRAVPLPSIVISPPLVNVSADTTSALEMLVLPTLKALPLVLAMVRPPVIVRVDPPVPPRSPPSRLIRPVGPLSVSPPLVKIEAPFCRNRAPVTLFSPTSALLVVTPPGASATSALLLTSTNVPAMVLICPPANSSSALPLRTTVPVSVLAVPKLAVPEVMSSVDRAVLLPAMLIWPVLFSPDAVTVSALVMPVLPILNALPLLLLIEIVPPIDALDPPLPPTSGPSRLNRPLPVMPNPPLVVDSEPPSWNKMEPASLTFVAIAATPPVWINKSALALLTVSELTPIELLRVTV